MTKAGCTVLKKRILVLGSTGSVGTSVLDVVSHHADRFEIVGLATRRNIGLLREQCDKFPNARVAITDKEAHETLVAESAALAGASVSDGMDGLIDLIDATKPDLVVNCLVGFAGLKPTLHSVSSGINVALANKESIVTGGELIRDESAKSGASIIPIDSEHVAISQCLRGSVTDDIEAVYITASGGALRDRPLDRLADVSPGDALAHPTWNMGAKITIDSATLMNKGLEVIEAHWLFDIPYDKIKVAVHPQSIIHSLVEFKDSSIIAQLGVPDMRLPILHALGYPERIETTLSKSRITDFPNLTFAEVEDERYPCFKLAVEAGKRGGNMPTVLNSANEVAVGAFLAGVVPFSRIQEIISAALDGIAPDSIRSFEDVYETDRATRAYIKEKFGV
jgi:1-deoxy-D-xylulose-5-phosphate reductoisomerase